jgi:hypothetical protein
MPVIGLNLKSVKANIDEGKFKENVSKQITINHSVPSIENIKEVDVGAEIENVIGVDFKFSITYSPGIGSVDFSGEVLYQAEDASKILKEWGEKKVDALLALEVLNTVFRQCLTKSVVLSEMVRLPPPVEFPMVRARVPDKAQAAPSEVKGKKK